MLVCTLDDPLIWGFLPLRYMFNPSNLRWGLASYDICFQNKPQSVFFTFGQTLPTHRQAYSPHGGLFQPTITQTIRLLSNAPFHPEPDTTAPSHASASSSPSSPDLCDPFSSAQLTYSTNGEDTFPAPSAYLSRRHSWVHIFPEGKVHQHPHKSMRYFKWGVARLILEAEPCPDVLPMWISGPEEMMPESRPNPRFLPRFGQHASLTFGSKVDTDGIFGDLRSKWRDLVTRERAREGKSREMGDLSEELMYGKEAVNLRIECTRRVRQEVLKLRRQTGLPDEDPKAGIAETWAVEGGKREGKMQDGSWVKDT